MDDSYPLPKECHAMGKGTVTEVAVETAIVRNEWGSFEIRSEDTFKNRRLNLTKTFNVGDEVVFKADRVKENGSNGLVATYVRKTHTCYSGEGTIDNLFSGYGHMTSTKKQHGRLFFNATGFGDYEVYPYYKKIRDCKKFFRPGDTLKYLALKDGRDYRNNNNFLYCMHFELCLNMNYNDRKPCTGIVVGLTEDFGRREAYCTLWVKLKNCAFIDLQAYQIHPELKSLKNVLQIGDRLSFRFQRDDDTCGDSITDVRILDEETQHRLRQTVKDCHNSSRSQSAQQSKSIGSSSIKNEDFCDSTSDLRSRVSTACDEDDIILSDSYDEELGDDYNNDDDERDVSPKTNHSSSNATGCTALSNDLPSNNGSFSSHFVRAPGPKPSLPAYRPPNLIRLSPTALRELDLGSNAPIFPPMQNCSEQQQHQQLNTTNNNGDYYTTPAAIGRKQEPDCYAIGQIRTTCVSDDANWSENMIGEKLQQQQRPNVIGQPTQQKQQQPFVKSRNDAQTQTEPFLEMAMIEELMNDQDVFVYVATKKPEFIYKWYSLCKR